MKDALGDRMKSYEAAYSPRLTPRLPVIVRVDGRAFHTLTRNFRKPFDPKLTETMDKATYEVSRKLQGCILAYTQSDEASFILQTDRHHETQSPCGGDVIKLVTTTASAMTVAYNSIFQPTSRNLWGEFDARAFVMPWDEVPNYLIWRFRDARRNSVTMKALSMYSHKELLGKSTQDKLIMMRKVPECAWEKESARNRNGNFIGGSLNLAAEKLRLDKGQSLTWGIIDEDITRLRTQE